MSMDKRKERAQIIARYQSIEKAVESGALAQFQDVSVSEAIVLGLYRQGVRKYLAVFGHGTTDIAEALRVYEEAGLVKIYNVRHETAGAHAATALKMLTGETPAVVTSIGPGAMHAFAGSLCSLSNGAGVYHIYGDETTHGEGFNMQQIPKDEQGLFLRLTSIMGNAYSVYEPWSVIAALRMGASTTGAAFAQPFFLLAPMNVQPVVLRVFNLLELPDKVKPQRLSCHEDEAYIRATDIARQAKCVTVKIGQGARGCGKEIIALANLLDAAIVSGPNATGIVPFSEPRYMTVGGSKGSISGNYAMNVSDLVIVIGARAVCQWDCSGTAWKKAQHIINFNINPVHAAHYNRSIPIVGDARLNLKRWIEYLKAEGFIPAAVRSEWMRVLRAKREEWEAFKQERYSYPPLYDEVWKREILTQPAAIKTVCDFADAIGAVKIFDAGDVQANGFQIVQDEHEYQTLTDTGSSYMGFAASAVLVSSMSDIYPVAFCGDGSFMMNPQILIDGVEHRARGCIVVFDNRRMAAISGLQYAQYGTDYKTNDAVSVDYVAMANAIAGIKGIWGGCSVKELKDALAQTRAHDGIALVHVPVYSGSDERAGMGVFGDWNVGNWCERVQAEHHRLGL